MGNNQNPEHKEGKLAKAIEEQTAKLPSDIFLWASLGSMALSPYLPGSWQKAHKPVFWAMGSAISFTLVCIIKS